MLASDASVHKVWIINDTDSIRQEAISDIKKDNIQVFIIESKRLHDRGVAEERLTRRSHKPA